MNSGNKDGKIRSSYSNQGTASTLGMLHLSTYIYVQTITATQNYLQYN